MYYKTKYHNNSNIKNNIKPATTTTTTKATKPKMPAKNSYAISLTCNNSYNYRVCSRNNNKTYNNNYKYQSNENNNNNNNKYIK